MQHTVNRNRQSQSWADEPIVHALHPVLLLKQLLLGKLKAAPPSKQADQPLLALKLCLRT